MPSTLVVFSIIKQLIKCSQMVGMIIEGNDQSINVGRLLRSDSSSQRPPARTVVSGFHFRHLRAADACL